MRPRADTRFVWMGGRCSYGCHDCPIDQAAALPGIEAAALRDALSGVTRRLVVLVGGEPFLRSDLIRLLATIGSAGCVPGLVTTGRPLLYPQVRERLRAAGLGYLRVQLFGDRQAHDAVAAIPGAYEQAVAGLQQWIGGGLLDCDVDVSLTLRGRPLERAAAMVDTIAEAIPRHPRVRLLVAIDAAAGRAARDHLRTALADRSPDPRRPLLGWDDAAPVFAGAPPAACCLGAVDVQAAAPAEEPAEQVKANSFNFVRAGETVPWSAEASGCTAHAHGTGIDPLRQLWLIEGGRLTLHVSDTGDFSAVEIAQVKDEWSHLFVDRAAAGVLDDFTEGMRRVLPDPVCDACAERPRCGRRFRIIDGPPYAREEARIGRHVAELRGRVLDVGCGEQLYRAELAPLLRSGAVQYTGLDPDEPSLAVARTALPEGRFALGGIEEFRGEPSSYDHILCLRSLNHVRDLDEALARMAVLLKPGGRLLIVECTPFAMLRRPEQVAAADRAPRAGHQHFRNVASDEVVPLAERRGLEVVEHHPAGRAGTNEWILLLART